MFRSSLFICFQVGRQFPAHLAGTKVVQICGYKEVAHNYLKVLKYFCIVSLA